MQPTAELRPELRGQFCPWEMPKCFYCGQKTYRGWTKTSNQRNKLCRYTRDHVFPARFRRRLGPKDNYFRYLTVTCCQQCNAAKRDKMPSGVTLRRLGLKIENGRYVREVLEVVRTQQSNSQQPVTE